VSHDLELDADLSLGGIEIERFKFRHGASLLSGSGFVKNWNAPVLSINTAGVMDARDLILADSSLYEGRGAIDVQAVLRFDQDGVYSKGRFSARTGGYRKMSYASLAGNYEILHDVLFLRDVTGQIAKGSFWANGDIQLREAKTPNRVTILAKDVPIIEAGRLLNVPEMDFENTADATTILTWHEDQDLRVDCDARLHGLAQATTSGRSTLLEGSVRFTYFETGEAFISSADLSSPYTAVQVSGGEGAAFHVQLSTNRISEPFHLIAGFSPPVADLLARQPDLLETAGAFDFKGDVRIKSSSDIEYRGSISIRNGRWRSFKVEALSTTAIFSSPRLQLQSLLLQSGPQNVKGDLELGLNDQGDLSSLGFHGSIHQVSLASLKDFGADTSGIGGILSGSGSVIYRQGSWEGEGRFSLERGTYGGESFDSLRAELRLNGGQLHILQAEARRGTAQAAAEGQVDLGTQQLAIAAHLHGLSLEEIPALQQKHLPIHGLLSASCTLAGTLRNPALAGDFQLDSVQYEHWDIGHGKGRVRFRDQTLEGSAGVQSSFGSLTVQATLSTGAGYPGKVALEFENLDVQKIVPAKAPSYLKELSTALRGKIDIEGKFEDLPSLRIHGEVDGAHFKIHDYEMHNTGAIQFTVLNRDLRIESVRFVGEGTSLLLSGTVPLDDSPQLDLNLNGSLNLRLLEGIEKGIHASGAVALNIRASGSKQNPQVIGRASLQDARLDYPDLPFRFSSLQGDMVFSRNLVRLENVRAAVASGTLQLSGVIEHQNAVLRSLNLALSIRNARLPYPKDFRSVASANLVLSGTRDAQILSGEVDVARMEYVRSFNLLEQLASRSATQPGPLTTAPYLLGLRLNVEIHSDNGLYIDNELARLRGSLRLTLRGTPAYPSLTGRVEASEGGAIFFRGNRFEILRAVANFVDRNRINPILEIRAEAEVKTYRVTLDVNGDLDHLNLNLTSDPAMSTVDILSLLTTGKADTTAMGLPVTTPNVTSHYESEMTGMSAASVLSENLTGVIGKRVQRLFGLESFRVDPFLAGTTNDPTARLTISERLSKDLVVTFSRNLTTSAEQIVVIEYSLSKNVSVVATRDEFGSYGLDFRFRKRMR
jgi:hypothetical protein